MGFKTCQQSFSKSIWARGLKLGQLIWGWWVDYLLKVWAKSKNVCGITTLQIWPYLGTSKCWGHSLLQTPALVKLSLWTVLHKNMLWVLIRIAWTHNRHSYGEIMKMIPKLFLNTTLSVSLSEIFWIPRRGWDRDSWRFMRRQLTPPKSISRPHRWSNLLTQMRKKRKNQTKL